MVHSIVMATDRGKRKRVRFTLEVNFERVVVKESFAKVLTAVRDLSILREAPKLTLHNLHLLLALVDGASPTVDCLPKPVRQRMLAAAQG